MVILYSNLMLIKTILIYNIPNKLVYKNAFKKRIAKQVCFILNNFYLKTLNEKELLKSIFFLSHPE